MTNDWELREGTAPFPWITVDRYFSPELIRAALAEWPDERWPWWHVYGDGNSNKLASKDPSRISPASTRLLNEMSSFAIHRLNHFAETNVFPDLSLHGAGMHCIGPSGFLKAHLDSDHHPSLGWTRELSGVLFLNEHWEPSWGGELQLLDSTGTEVIQCFQPTFNRLILFSCRNQAWHQVAPVTCPPGESRKTLALFWWSNRPSAHDRPTAVFQSPAACAADSPTSHPSTPSGPNPVIASGAAETAAASPAI